MKIELFCVVLFVFLTTSHVTATLDVIGEALQAFSCGCGCKFYDVGTCETRVKTECEVKYNNVCNPVWENKCETIPKQNCKTEYKNECKYDKQCSTSYKKECVKVPQKNCKTVYDKKCHQIPKKNCKTVYTQQCKKVPKKNCQTVYDKKCTNEPKQTCKNEQVCKTTYEQKCKPSYNYGQTCENVPKKKCEYQKKCSTTYSQKCTNIPRQQCSTTYDNQCQNIPKQQCETTYDQKCESTPKELCQTTYSNSCKDVPQQNCKNVKSCVKVPQQKCWTTKELKCRKESKTSCKKVPNKKCWKVHIKKNRYVKRKQCQKCNRKKETTYSKVTRNNCKIEPRQECRTLYFNNCKKIPQQECRTVYKKKCGWEKQCVTKYHQQCQKQKPAYGAPPSYGPPKETCKSVPRENCKNVLKCTKVPSQQCSTQYRKECKKVPSEKCRTVKELKCNPYQVDVPQTKVIASCSWPPKRHHDQFCTRRSDTDIFLTDGSDYSPSVEYEDTFIDTRIDYVETFPDTYDGTPNMTVTQDGREVYPQAASYPEVDIVEYSPEDETFNPGSEIALSQNQNHLAVAGIFQEVDSPNLQNQQNSRMEEPKAFYPENAESEEHLKGFVDPFPDFTPNHDREAGQEQFINFGHKLSHHDEEPGTTSLILSELDATAFDRSDEGVIDTENPTVNGQGHMKQAYNGESERRISSFKQDFESSFNPGFSNFGSFEGDPKVTWLWGSKTEE